MLLYIWLVALLAALYVYCRQIYSRFSKYGVKNMKPIPLLGNMSPILLRTKHFIDIVVEQYNMFPEERFIGNFEFIKPMLIIRDIELIKRVTVKDFEHFLDHRTIVSEEADPFFGRSLISLKGQEWKDMRSTLSPAFTSSKMKHMLPFIVEVGDQMIMSLKKQLNESKNGYIDVETKDMSSYYTNDVIASCAFGLKVNSFADPHNEFYKMAYKSTNFGFAVLLKIFGYASFPYLMKLIKASIFPEDVKDFFYHLVLSTMKDRELHNILRPDMIHLLMEAKKGRLVHDDSAVKDADAGFATVEESSVGKKSNNRAWSDIDLIAQAVLFFIAGYETVSIAMTFLMYELALHPEVQDKLSQEIREHDAKNSGKFNYNSIQTMTYLDMVVSEVLRLWPPALATDRICCKDFNMGKPNDKATQDYILKKGESLTIPAVAIHRDPQYYPEPMKFDPERFSEDNKHNIQPFTYMPFGLGPRNCIGSRFALCEVKVMIYQLLQHFELMPCERTTIPCELSTDNMNLRIKGGHWLRMKLRPYQTCCALKQTRLNQQEVINWQCPINWQDALQDTSAVDNIMISIMLLYIWLVALVAALYLYCRQAYSRFSKYGVKNMKPIPILGNMSSILFRTKHFAYAIEELYKKFPDERFVGNFEFVRPVLLIRDIELIKKITVKDFEHFLDHRTFISEEVDPFFGRNLFSLKGQEWKDMRSTLSPAFTSSKMKHMLPFMVEVGNQMILSLKEQLRESKDGYIDIETKDLSTHYTNDVIASCAFGLKVNSHIDPDNEFYKMGYKSTNFGFAVVLKFLGYASFPKLMKLLKANLFPDDVKNFFHHLVMNTMNDREVHNIFRPDMIHLLMEAKKGRLAHDENSVKDADAGFATVEESTFGRKSVNRAWSDVDLVAQAVIFFVAGFETVSTAMTFLMYELALNPDVQEKLAQEIREHESKSAGKFNYNSIQTMSYMDMVVSELLRLWPPAIATDRVCSKDYNLGRPNYETTQDFIVKKGEGVNIPVMAIHRDAQYFPDPLKFDPERFSDENKHKIKPFTYLPFGLGPRNCIGSRFALCEVKVMVYQLLQHFELMPCERTTIPCKLATDNFNLRIKGGHWLRLKPRP